MERLVKLLIISMLVAGAAGQAASTEIKSAEITDKVDRDGDGRISSFKVRITADLSIDEAGAEYGDGVLPGKIDFAGGAGQLLEPEGDPKFNVILVGGRESYRIDMFANPPMSKNTGASTFNVEYDYSEVEQFIDENSAKNFIQSTENIAEGRVEVTGFKVQYRESDSCNTCMGTLDTVVDDKLVNVESFRLEEPAKDRAAEVSIDANTDAKLYLNGERKGKTPWTGDLPVDVSERELVNLRLEAPGYRTLTAQEELSPPESRSYELEKKMRPLVVDSEPEGATVRVNGQKIGEAPVSKKYWMNRELDVRVEGENDTRTFSDVQTPWRRTVDFTSGSGGGSYDFGTGFDYEPTFSYDLLSEIDLTGLTVPQFSPSVENPGVGEKVEFNGSDSYSVGYNITSYGWDLGDGTTKTGETVEHSYSSPGNYTVNLTVENSNGTSVHAVRYVNVENLKPRAAFAVQGNGFETGKPVTFDASPSTDPDGTIGTYSWAFGDGSQLSGPSTKRTHVYSSPGTYTVQLEVADGLGAKDKVTRTVRIRSPNRDPSAGFTVSDSSPETGDRITLDASSSSDPDGSIATYAWSMGDGFSKTGQSITYSYNVSGSFDVKLIVVDDRGAKSEISRTVTVSAPEGGRTGTGSGDNSTDVDQNGSANTSENTSSDDAEEETGGIGQILVNLIQAIF